jgi:hypothetical protein
MRSLGPERLFTSDGRELRRVRSPVVDIAMIGFKAVALAHFVRRAPLICPSVHMHGRRAADRLVRRIPPFPALRV